ncbi:MAG: hypothetical protein FJ123_00165 [Deltaproteobacteria bacterium]|nr:hypothetical protein [Deltaproteobacteria bacterium]
MPNLFLDLSRHLPDKYEDFLTNSFVYLIKYFLENQREYAISFINFLCFENTEHIFRDNESIFLEAQKGLEGNAPDITINSDDKIILLEIKHEAGLGPKQIEKYRKSLKNENKQIKRISLITKYAISGEEFVDAGKPDHYLRWYQIHEFLCKKESKDIVGKYLIGEFLKYLEENQMTIQKVTWEYSNGVRAFNNLIEMMGRAIEELHIKIYTRVGAWEWKGYYLESKNLFVGIDFNEPEWVYFELVNIKNFKPQAQNFDYEISEYSEGTTINLSLEDTHFFALKQEEQLRILKEFIFACHQESKSINIIK